MIRGDSMSLPIEIPVFNSIEDIERYLSQEFTDEKKWGILYPLIIEVKLLGCRIRRLKRKAVWAFQRIVRKHHASDKDLQMLDLHVAKIILPKLEALRNQGLSHSPANEMEICINILDEIIYAFKWNI